MLPQHTEIMVSLDGRSKLVAYSNHRWAIVFRDCTRWLTRSHFRNELLALQAFTDMIGMTFQQQTHFIPECAAAYRRFLGKAA